MRITCGDYALRTVLLPKLTPLLCEYPDITFEFDMSYSFRDIVADRFDAGVRLGNTIENGSGAARRRGKHSCACETPVSPMRMTR